MLIKKKDFVFFKEKFNKITLCLRIKMNFIQRLVIEIVLMIFVADLMECGPVAYGACMATCFCILTGCMAASATAGAAATAATAGAAAAAAIAGCQAAGTLCYQTCYGALLSPTQ
jgi:hypothetical protein